MSQMFCYILNTQIIKAISFLTIVDKLKENSKQQCLPTVSRDVVHCEIVCVNVLSQISTNHTVANKVTTSLHSVYKSQFTSYVDLFNEI